MCYLSYSAISPTTSLLCDELFKSEKRICIDRWILLTKG